MSNGTKRKPTPKPESSEAIEAEAPKQSQQRENGGTSEIEGVTLESPAQPAESGHYLAMVTKFQDALEHTNIRVTHITIPTAYAPSHWKSEVAGAPVVAGDVFAVKTNKGHLIIAKE